MAMSEKHLACKLNKTFAFTRTQSTVVPFHAATKKLIVSYCKKIKKQLKYTQTDIE